MAPITNEIFDKILPYVASNGKILSNISFFRRGNIGFSGIIKVNGFEEGHKN